MWLEPLFYHVHNFGERQLCLKICTKKNTFSDEHTRDINKTLEKWDQNMCCGAKVSHFSILLPDAMLKEAKQLKTDKRINIRHQPWHKSSSWLTPTSGKSPQEQSEVFCCSYTTQFHHPKVSFNQFSAKPNSRIRPLPLPSQYPPDRHASRKAYEDPGDSDYSCHPMHLPPGTCLVEDWLMEFSQ